ncbi:MAG: S1C family serine protease [Lacipirellulaceae bacterium]
MPPRTRILVPAVAVLAIGAGSLFGQLAPAPSPLPRSIPAPPNPASPGASLDPRLTPEELANIRVYETANRGVVNITTSTVQVDPLFRLPVAGEGSGSGAVIDQEGHVITNHHVIEGAREIEVTFSDGRSYPAELVGSDNEYDLAVLKVAAPREALQPVALGRSETLRVGQRAYVLGNPFGLEGSLTTGIVSSLNRSLPSRVTDRVVTGMIQTDAAMNPGNSGGPMLNSSGEMIGMCVAIRSSVGQNSGVGFAIPVDRIRRFVPELIATGKVLRAYHGIVLVNPTARGLRIAKLSPGGPAERAGLQGFREVMTTKRQGPFEYRVASIDREGADYIVAIDGRPIRSHEEFLAAMDAHRPGDRVVLTVTREGAQRDVPLVLGEA